MSLRDVLAYVQQQQRIGVCVTPVTPENSMGLQPEPAWIGACTPDTPDTPRFDNTQVNTLHAGAADTPDTPEKNMGYQPEPAWIGACTPDTPDTPRFDNTQVNTPNPAPEPTNWLVLDQAYMRHHLNCAVCKAAGRGVRYGLRCGVGAALWTAYETAARNTPPPWHKPKKGQRHD